MTLVITYLSDLVVQNIHLFMSPCCIETDIPTRSVSRIPLAPTAFSHGRPVPGASLQAKPRTGTPTKLHVRRLC